MTLEKTSQGSTVADNIDREWKFKSIKDSYIFSFRPFFLLKNSDQNATPKNKFCGHLLSLSVYILWLFWRKT